MDFSIEPAPEQGIQLDEEALKKELESIGYKLEIVNRFSTLHFDARLKALNCRKVA